MLELDQVYTLLRRLGINATYKGFFLTADAVRLCAQRQDCLLLLTKELYPAVARQYGTNWRTVERNIRTVAAAAWEKNPELLSQLAGAPLDRRPTAGRFLAILSGSLLDGGREAAEALPVSLSAAD